MGIGILQQSQKVAVIFPKLSSFAGKIMIEEAMLSEEKFLLGEFEKYGIHPDIYIVPIEPTPQEVSETIQAVQTTDRILLFCFDAHLYPSNKDLLDKAQSIGKNEVIVLLRDPYDIEFVKEENLCLTDFGWRNCQIKANIWKICASK
ncbi:MAG: hypothetical protein HYY63_02730 [Elusimicrobia bacterium]|nr:hypothetical protein [Elusimicrobiota bacterium]